MINWEDDNLATQPAQAPAPAAGSQGAPAVRAATGVFGDLPCPRPPRLNTRPAWRPAAMPSRTA